MSGLRPGKAIQALRTLKEEGAQPGLELGGPSFDAWKSKVRGVLVGTFGEKDQTVVQFSGVSYWVNGNPRTIPQSEKMRARRQGIEKARGHIDGAIHRLELRTGGEDLIDERSFDPELWAHVANHVVDEQWTTVASQTAIFLEDTLRKWVGDPKDKNGDSLYGQSLYASVPADESDLRLGRRAGERAGWRALGTGFAQAIGNVDRHRIQNRTTRAATRSEFSGWEVFS